MFDFLFKRSPKTPSVAAPTATPREQEQAETQQRKQAALNSRKETALQELARLHGQEPALVDFILGCDLADVRLKAAEQLHGAEALEKVQQAMRNSDRRVAKLAQGRLRDLAAAGARRQQAQAAVDTARALVQSPTLALNKVAELDAGWQQLAVDDSSLQQAFTEARTALGERLRAQGELQRALAQALAELREMAAGAGQMSASDLGERLEQLANEVALYAAAPESHVLQKPILAQFAQEYAALHASVNALQRRDAAMAARESALQIWEALDASELKPGDMKRQWQSMPPLADADAASQQQRFEQQLRRNVRSKDVVREVNIAPLEAGEAQQAFAAAVDALDAALQDGLLQLAATQDRILRGLDLALVRPSEAQMMRLTQLRAEMTRLRDWAKWGGNVSREELCKAVEELPGQELSLTELARRVGSSRERWKSLDLSAGAAPKGLWERFDAACTTAYAPVAAHYQQLAEERQQNQAQAQGLIDDVRLYAQSALAAADTRPDWKAISAFARDVRLAWKRLGTIERREKKRLDSEFEAALQTVLEPLAAEREAELARREALIAEAARLDSSERGAMDKLRALQTRWQEQARALPLERADEQVLWQRFRAACDTFFARRKASADAADGERQAHLAAAEALCITVETAVAQAGAGTILREAQAAWKQLGQLPRAQEALVQQRFDNAVAAVQEHLDAGKRAAVEARSYALRDKLQLCREAEAALTAKKAPASDFATALQTRWDAVPALAAEDERQMLQRFTAALAAFENGAPDYLVTLKQRQAAFAEALLRQEIMTGVDSPPELAAQRLKLQVEVLQASMKSGQKPAAQRAQLIALCAMPVLADAAQNARLDALLAKVQG